MIFINCTAATLRSVLCFIDSGVTPRVAFDRDDLADALAEKVKAAVGDSGGSEEVSIRFADDEVDLRKQFVGVCENIEKVFRGVVFASKT